jgi:hypothetical protein
MREQDKQRADEMNRAKLATIGHELMDAFNHTKKDPSQMAVNGHDTSHGYQFFIDRGGETIRITVDRDTS